MNLAALIPVALKTSIFLTVFGIGLKATLGDATWLLRHPGQLGKSLMAMNVLVPLFAVALAAAFDLHPVVKIALVLLAVSPVPPFLPKKLLKAGGHQSYVYGLLLAATLLSLVLVPVSVAFIGRLFGRDVHVASSVILQAVLTAILLPLAAGMSVRAIMPNVAERLEPVVTKVGGVLLLAAVPIIFTAWPAISMLIGNGSVGAIVAMVLAGLAVGHLLGGPDEDNRTVLGLASASRHPGVAMAVAHATFPSQKLVPAAVLLYLLVSIVVTLPYVNLRKRRQAAVATPRPVRH